MIYILETERLLLRQFITTDTKFVIELVNSPGWLKFIGDRNIKTTAQATEYLVNGPLKSYNDNGFGLWLVETKNDQTPIGMCGILKRAALESPDIGFAFLPAFNGKGFAFEIANATMLFANNVLKLPVVLAITVSGNIKSIQLLEKIGLKFNKTIQWQSTNEALLLYST